ncbi:MAG TPA: ImmA/IrrE family metallo-endopeptidase [Pyrinomonadaceae bacterium]|jgi:Zn-dependent peptidase ImmA (M78 family)|nr:ImmA/IrrE family metallo-endopeptidase [Pyrinomonadaceae bacterium]
MQFFIEKISRLRFSWNKRPLTETDFYRLCRRFRIHVTEMPLQTNGFYYCMKGRHFIALDSRLTGHKKLFVMFHELAHFLMHSPDAGVTANFHGVGKKTRKEMEADAFALCAILPKQRIENQTPYELADDEGIPADIISQRIGVYRKYGI